MHQNNELVFKHNLIAEYLPSDEQILAEEDFHILNIEISNAKGEQDVKIVKGNFSNILVILETPSILQMVQNMHQIYKTVRPYLNAPTSAPLTQEKAQT
jgi:hypothetical protein